MDDAHTKGKGKGKGATRTTVGQTSLRLMIIVVHCRG